MAIGQATFGLISAVMFAGLLDDRGFTVGVEDERKAVQARRWTQWTGTTGFYSFWGWSIINANRHWRTNVDMHNVSMRPDREYLAKPTRVQVQLTFPTR